MNSKPYTNYSVLFIVRWSVYMCRSGSSSVLSLYLYLSSRHQTQVASLVQQAPLPAEPSPGQKQQCPVYSSQLRSECEDCFEQSFVSVFE